MIKLISSFQTRVYDVNMALLCLQFKLYGLFSEQGTIESINYKMKIMFSLTEWQSLCFYGFSKGNGFLVIVQKFTMTSWLTLHSQGLELSQSQQ